MNNLDDLAKQIAETMDQGMRCFVHKETRELVSFPDEDKFPGFDDEEWRVYIDKVEDNSENYKMIEPMDSRHSFRTMENFIYSLPPSAARNRLEQAINGHKPFANFRKQLNFSYELKNQWFNFKLQELTQWVKAQLEMKWTGD